jgi:hypothetical protein
LLRVIEGCVICLCVHGVCEFAKDLGVEGCVVCQCLLGVGSGCDVLLDVGEECGHVGSDVLVCCAAVVNRGD